jgi:hypothetical protein
MGGVAAVRRDRNGSAVILDDQSDRVFPIIQAHLDVIRGRVPADVGQRFLGRAVHSQASVGGQFARLAAHVDRDRQAALLRDRLGQAADALGTRQFITTRGGDRRGGLRSPPLQLAAGCGGGVRPRPALHELGAREPLVAYLVGLAKPPARRPAANVSAARPSRCSLRR